MLTFGIYFSSKRHYEYIGLRFLQNILKWNICSLVRVNSHCKTNYHRKARTLDHNSLDVCQMEGCSPLYNHHPWRRLKPPQKTNAHTHGNSHNASPPSFLTLWPLHFGLFHNSSDFICQRKISWRVLKPVAKNYTG